MDPMLLHIFQLQVLTQCQFVVLAAEEVNRGIAETDSRRVFFALQSLLNAAANISKACWGSRGRLAVERQALRDSIGLGDESSLRDMTMRNNFEHFDERLDDWWINSTDHNYADMNIGPRRMISGLSDIDMFRTFDPQTAELVFWSQAFNMQALVTEAQRILPNVVRQVSRPPRPGRPG